MPARVQARDASVLRKELKCNIVRTSHYPQSPAFLTPATRRLVVLEEIPGCSTSAQGVAGYGRG